VKNGISARRAGAQRCYAGFSLARSGALPHRVRRAQRSRPLSFHRLRLVARQWPERLPDERRQFPGHGYEGAVAVHTASQERHEPEVEAVLCLPTGLDDSGRLALLTAGESLAHLRWGRVVLAAFDQEPACVRVAALGNCALATSRSAGLLGRNQSEVAHQLPGMLEAVKIAQFGDGDHRCNELEAFERHECLDGRPQTPVGEESLPRSHRDTRAPASVTAMRPSSRMAFMAGCGRTSSRR